jgi:hypothetical protein
MKDDPGWGGFSSPGVLLENGKYLVGSSVNADTYLYDPAKDEFASAGKRLRKEHSDYSVFSLLHDGTVLSSGYWEQEGPSYAQRYIPSQNAWINSGKLPDNFRNATVDNPYPFTGVTLPSGDFFLVGRRGRTATYNLQSNRWSAGPALPRNAQTSLFGGVFLPNGHFMFMVVIGDNHRLMDYDYKLNTMKDITSSLPPKLAELFQRGVANSFGHLGYLFLLPNGNLGLDTEAYDGVSRKSYWEYRPGVTADQLSWVNAVRPLLHSVTQDSSNRSVFKVTGARTNGVWFNAAKSLNVVVEPAGPIVELRKDGRFAAYVETTGWAPGISKEWDTKQTNFKFQVPSHLPNGFYSVRVIAKGLPSSVACPIQVNR